MDNDVIIVLEFEDDLYCIQQYGDDGCDEGEVQASDVAIEDGGSVWCLIFLEGVEGSKGMCSGCYDDNLQCQ